MLMKLQAHVKAISFSVCDPEMDWHLLALARKTTSVTTALSSVTSHSVRARASGMSG
jgi:hypothetical protein